MNAKIGIIGGTGLYSLQGLKLLEPLQVTTPFGEPSSPIIRGLIDNVEVYFLARHGIGHRLMPSEVNSRANIYAMKEIGVSWCISVSAVGSLREDYSPGVVCLPDQLIDRTVGRPNTFFGEGLVAHVPFADPFCPVLREAILETAESINPSKVKNGGTYVCMEGPAFSTRAESNLYRDWGASLIGMTALPEAKLAREAEIGYAILSTVTDFDCWRSPNSDVNVEEILRVLSENVSFAQEILRKVIPRLSLLKPAPFVADALKFSILSDLRTVPAETKERLRPIIGRYIPSSGEAK